MSDERELATSLADVLGLADWAYVAFVVLIAIVSYVPVRLLLLPLINRMMERTKTKWDDILASKGVFDWLAALAPVLVLYFGAGYAPEYVDISWRRRGTRRGTV